MTKSRGGRKHVRVKIIDYLKEHRYATATQLAAAIGCTEKSVNRAMSQLGTTLYVAGWNRNKVGDFRRIMGIRIYPDQLDQPRPTPIPPVERVRAYVKRVKARQKQVDSQKTREESDETQSGSLPT